MSKIALSEEQEYMIDAVLKGKNVLVDACIGSGKTTTIQQLCLRLPDNKRILYLTYNKLLKFDAQDKIVKELKKKRKNSNYEILNYNGYAYKHLLRAGINNVGVSEQVGVFNKVKPSIFIPDILIIDEYQDIREEHSEMLKYIKSKNPKMQIVMVGDIDQKIYDNTNLDVMSFAKKFLGKYEKISFTKCFRISSSLADALGSIWNKKIDGVNKNCRVREITFNDFISIAKDKKPSEVLCLGSHTGPMTKALNVLEEKYPDVFNKNTVYASIRDSDTSISVSKNCAIFTTYDGSKGMERDYCFVFDFTEEYWRVRSEKTNQRYEILRNLFCVAASRGKKGVYFVSAESMPETPLSFDTIKYAFETKTRFTEKLDISKMFEFQFKEHIEDCFDLLDVKPKKKRDLTSIDVKTNDGLIDLSPCIGTFQEACFFTNYKMEEAYNLYNATRGRDSKRLDFESVRDKTLDEQICVLTAAETKHNRYTTQVILPLVTEMEKERICNRLKTVFKKSEWVQVPCNFDFGFVPATGLADVVKNNIVYELKFVSELQHTHYLQCAMYMIALNLQKGILWNVKNNEMYEIEIKDRKKFLSAVVKTITKGRLDKMI